MSVTMDDSIKRWTAKRKTALVVEIIQGKTTVAEASRSFDLSPSEIEGWIDRERLLDISGRSRKIQFQLAERFHLTSYKTPAGGCLLRWPRPGISRNCTPSPVWTKWSPGPSFRLP